MSFIGGVAGNFRGIARGGKIAINLRDLHAMELRFPGLRIVASEVFLKEIDEMTTLILAEFDAETRFNIRAARGTGKELRGLALLDKAAGN